jgi:hypothetical protein
MAGATADGRVLLTLEGRGSDGTTHLLFEPVELLERSPPSRRARASTSCCTCSRRTVGGGPGRVAYGRDTLAPSAPGRQSSAVHHSRRPHRASLGRSVRRLRGEPASAMSVEDPPPRPAPRTWSWADLLCATRSRWTSRRASPPRLPTAGDRPKVCKRRFTDHAALHALASAPAFAASQPAFFPTLSCTLSLTARHRACYMCFLALDGSGGAATWSYQRYGTGPGGRTSATEGTSTSGPLKPPRSRYVLSRNGKAPRTRARRNRR